ncbi:MAG TPA: hypothetical protein VFB50_11635, partial [Chloroflexota bacterium]|nr:hypothetical protein [Chloroflexota bacterium]
PDRNGYRRAAVRHVKQLPDLNHARQLLYASNLGVVTFRRPTPTTLEAIHELMALHPESPAQNRGEVFTRHVVPLDVGPQERPHVGVPG